MKILENMKVNSNKGLLLLRSCLVLLLTSAVVLLSSCADVKKHYLIGVSQCSEDSWRSKLNSELEQSTYFNEGVSLVMRTADDNIEQQRKQIQELVDMNIDLLIVSPQQTGNLSDAISIAVKKNIPVILFDRKSGADNYTAFMGADNYLIGQMMADYAASQLAGRGNIVEIAGEHNSSPAIERHNGFNDAIQKYPDIHIVGYAEGDWKQPSGELAMQKILDHLYPMRNGEVQEGPQIDCIFGGNDRMAVGARKTLEKFVQVHPEINHHLHPAKMLYLGVDALPTPGGGIEKVRDGELTVSAIYPTHGDELMELALNILNGKNYEKETMMETNLVTQANARVLLMQHKEVENQIHYIKRMHARVISTLSLLDTQRIILFGIIGMTFILGTFTILIVRAYRVKRNLNQALRKKNDELNDEKATVEHQRDELEEQRDQLLDLMETLKNTNDHPGEELPHDKAKTKEQDEENGGVMEENSFVSRFLHYVGDHLSNPDLSVEDIGEALCLSRVQLYRKIKSMTGKTPVEIIREERLKRARILLEDASLSISEVAYKVGFSAPSYFTKCYKDYYGKAPSGK